MTAPSPPAGSTVVDPYLDPTTGVLRKRLGARTQDDLDQRAANLTAATLYRLHLHPVYY